MGMLIDIDKGNIGNINALSGKFSAAVNISGFNKTGVLSVAFHFSPAITAITAVGKWKLQQSLDGEKFDFVRDAEGNDIEISFPVTAITAAHITNFSNLHTTYIRIAGTNSGTNGVISKIQIIAK